MDIQSAIVKGTNILKDQHISTAKLDAEILMAKAIGQDRKYIILNNNKNVEDVSLKYFEKLIKERASRKPIAYLINKKYFWNSEFFVTKNTLIPRPDTELVVEKVLDLTVEKKYLNMLEVGIGSGCFDSDTKILPCNCLQYQYDDWGRPI